ncbi:putative baseplate assembly protein [Nostocaceae cyanobacterium CENA369]|uniref:Putative baseplate assembly protein n=1 Tax=Dendronalium phyllosphericum CENA369 TaxID=1725256 RepID=A0A8J7IA30_9NOST|nr:putative baseplate assembly protein [Dendronalium phyllosphericum]MBH8578159.1 putative baseplate assembly protein [Dendronalium phyllosphericum CENA369]
MNSHTLTFQNEQRRQEIRRQRKNGLDYVEVSDDLRSLYVYFLGSVPQDLKKENLLIEGGQRIRNLHVINLEIENPPNCESYLTVNLDQTGDFSVYTLRLVSLDEHGKPTNQPYPNFDPRYSLVQFKFRDGICNTDMDCLQQQTCPPPQLVEPAINYLAKDYASFRQLILDRLSLIMPDWEERHVPDLGITLVEILAYVGDYLSYYQDAVATEAYLETARQRISVRRHARLIDYPMHEGCNARTWLWLETSINISLEAKNFYFITSYKNAPPLGTILEDIRHLDDVPPSSYEVFEPLTPLPIHLYKAHNQILFYTWGDRSCCLPPDSTTATLLDEFIQHTLPEKPNSANTQSPEQQRKLHLKIGDILIFEEIRNPKTGILEDADMKHRHAVRLTNVKASVDELYNQPIVEIEWSKEDALPFPLCISAIVPPDCQLVDISVARGNVILVDRGRTIEREDLGTVPGKEIIQGCQEEDEPIEILVVGDRFRPTLQKTPLTFSQPLPKNHLTQDAKSLLIQDPRQALPQIQLTNTVNNSIWTPQYDLIDSNSEDQHFVVEMDNDGQAHLRFGDGELGIKPAVNTHFQATYRVGNGLAGNISVGAISYIVFRNQLISGSTLQPHQPFPAQGGTAPEPLSQVKLYAPHLSHEKLERAITADDYAQLVIQHFSTKVQRAAATLRWTGSRYEVWVTVDPFDKDAADKKLLRNIATDLKKYRRIGHDVIVQRAGYACLDIAMRVDVKFDYLRGHVKATLLDIFSNRVLSDGQRGFFHPDNWTFGQGIALSQIVAKASTVPGVESVSVTKLERLFVGSNREIEASFLPIGAWEIARLDNNPNFIENGRLTLDLRGGR